MKHYLYTGKHALVTFCMHAQHCDMRWNVSMFCCITIFVLFLLYNACGYIFTARRCNAARCACHSISVCPSVTRRGIVSERMNVRWCHLHSWLVQCI